MILTTIIIAVGTLILAVLLKITYLYLKSYRMVLRSKCFEGPRAFPLIGNGHHFLGSTSDVYRTVQVLGRQYGSPMRLLFGPKLYFGIHDPEHIKIILTNRNSLSKMQSYDFFRPWMGEGLITAPASKWILHRKAIQPLFNVKVLETYTKVFVTKALLLAKRIDVNEKGREFDTYEYMSRYALDTICETALGVSLNAINKESTTYYHMVESVVEIIVLRITRPWLHPDIIFKYSPIGQRFFKCVNYIHRFTEKVLNSAQAGIDQEIEIEPKKSMASLLLNPTEGDYKFTKKEIRDEISTILAAGHETTANLLCYTLLVLAMYPEIQDKVYAEVREVFGECNWETLNITIEDLNRLEYLDRVIKETLRFFPTANLIGRCLEKDVSIGEYTLPAGCDVIIELTVLHRCEKYWPRPLEFIPDRFLPMHPLGPRHPYAYVPFSGGVRNCIGMRYATMSLKIVLSILISKYIIKTRIVGEPKDIELKVCITLKPTSPITVSLEKRFPA